MSDINSIDDFLNHRGREQSGGSFLKKSWKDSGSINVWLHMMRMPLVLWQHNFPTKTVLQDRDGGDEPKVVYWGRGYNCWEDESVLKKMYARNPDGSREVPPKACPLCKMIEWVYQRVEAGELSWVAPVFKFQGATKPEDNLIIHAGGLYNAFGGKLSDAEKGEVRRVGIKLTDVWRENGQAKLNYAFVLVDDAHSELGVQIMVETSLLGEKVKKVIADQRASKGEDKGNPLIHPYVIQLIHNKDRNIPFHLKYDARPIERIQLRPEIEELISKDPPSLDRLVRKPNAQTLRTMMEEYACVDMPFDEFFKDVPKADPEGDEEFPHGEEEEKPQARTSPKAQAKPEPPAAKTDEEIIPCDKCKYPMTASMTKCPKCGEEYEMQDDADAKAAAPSIPKGSGKNDRLGW